jgi:hypothetical protein
MIESVSRVLFNDGPLCVECENLNWSISIT